MKFFYFLILTVFLTACQDNHNIIPLGKHIEFLADQNFSIEQIASDTNLKWKKNNTDIINWGYINKNLWLRIEIQPFFKDYSYLTMDYAMIDHIIAYSWNNNKSSPIHYGDRMNFNNRKIQHIFPVYKLSDELVHNNYIYIFVKNEGAFTLPFYLKTENGFLLSSIFNYSFFFAVISILIAMIIFNIFIMMSIKDINYFYYILFIIAYIFTIASLDAVSFQFLWGNHPNWGNLSIPIFVLLVGITMYLFTMGFLEIKKTSRIVFISMFGIMALMSVEIILSFFLTYSAAIKIANITMISASIYLIIIGIIFLSVYKMKAARYFLFAWVILLISFMVFALKNLGILPHNFITNQGVKIGAIFEALLISLALTDKIDLLRKEKEASQREALEIQRKLTDEAERRLRITQIYTRKSIVDYIEKGLDPTTFEPINKKISILFSDIRDFTAVAEHFKTIDTVDLLNSYFDQMNECVMSRKGEIDKLIGDCIMALFYDSDNAILSAIEMREKLFKFNKRANSKVRLNNGIGINYGDVIIGNIGSSSKMDYTVIGDIVNSASRIESLTKYYGVSIIISDEIKAQLKGQYDIRFIDKINVKGRNQAITIYEVYDFESDTIKKIKKDIDKNLSDIYSLYQKGLFFEAASAYQEIIQKLGPHNWIPEKCKDPLIDFYYQRCLNLDIKVKKNLLENWNGIFSFEDK